VGWTISNRFARRMSGPRISGKFIVVAGLGDKVPFVIEAEFGHPAEKFRPVGNGPRINHCRDIIDMFLGSSFPEKEKLVDDDGLRRRKPLVAERAGQLAAVGEFPSGELAFSRQVTVCAQGTVLVDNIEMPPGLSLDFCEKNLFRRQVEIFDRKRADECVDMSRSEGKDKIGI